MNINWANGGCDQPESMTEFVGQDTAAAVSALGAGSSDEQFKLGSGMNEFRVELRNDFPLPANADLSVREQTWAKGDCRLTLWSVQRDGSYHVVRAMRWPAGAAF